MNEATLRKYSQALVTRYVKKYTEKYGKPPTDLNRYRDRWGFQGMVEDFGKDRAEQIMDFYLESNRPNHPVGYLLFNYDKVNETMIKFEEDIEVRKRIMEETRKRVEEWDGDQRG
jgi:hypothetical protein